MLPNIEAYQRAHCRRWAGWRAEKGKIWKSKNNPLPWSRGPPSPLNAISWHRIVLDVSFARHAMIMYPVFVINCCRLSACCA